MNTDLINLFDSDEAAVRKVLAGTLAGADDGELYLEHIQSEALSFDNGRLKGAYVGGAYRWEDRRILGYRLLKDSNGKDTASINVGDPMYGPTSSHYDMWVGYSRDITAKVNWRIQLNVRNILEADKLVPVSMNPDGVLALARIQEGMSWQLTNTFSF